MTTASSVPTTRGELEGDEAFETLRATGRPRLVVATIDRFRRVVQATVDDVAPGAAGEILTDALKQGSTSATRESGEAALVGGFIAAVFAGMSAMAQVERGANRIYGVERDRPFVRKYTVALLGAVSA